MSETVRTKARRFSAPRSGDRFEIRVDAGDLGLVVSVSGELAVATSPELAAALVGAGADELGAVIVDRSDVSFVDARSSGVIIAGRERLRFSSGGLVIRRPSRVARQLLELTALAGLIEHDTCVSPALLPETGGCRDPDHRRHHQGVRSAGPGAMTTRGSPWRQRGSVESGRMRGLVPAVGGPGSKSHRRDTVVSQGAGRVGCAVGDYAGFGSAGDRSVIACRIRFRLSG